jgi:long-chain fatty acid transport protein
MSYRNVLLPTFFLLLTCTLQAQNGAALLDFNARSAGRGGTTLGFFDSPELIATNPAGISFVKQSMIDANLSLLIPTLHFTNSANDMDGDNNIYPLPSVSYVNRPSSGAWSWGLGVFTTGGMGADYTLQHPLLGSQEYHSMLAVFQAGPSVSWEIAPGIAIGASAHLVYSQMEMKMPYSLSPTIMAGVADPSTGMTFGQMFSAPPEERGFGYEEVTAAADMKELAGISFQGKIGLAFILSPDLSLGIAYSSPVPLTYGGGTATMDMNNQFMDAMARATLGYKEEHPNATDDEVQKAVGKMFSDFGIDPSLGFASTYNVESTFGMPQTIGAGMKYSVSDAFRIGFDLDYVFWSSAFDEMELSLTNGSNANINRMMGGSTVETVFPMNWDDSFVAKVGFEYDASASLMLRAGYAYGSNPVPDETAFPVFPAIIEHHLMLGGSVFVPATPLAIHLAFEYGLNNEQTGASPHLVAQEYANSTSELATMLLHIAFTWTL